MGIRRRDERKDEAGSTTAPADGRAARVETEEVRAPRGRGDAGIRAAHDRFGGLDIPATLVGMLTALAFLILFGGLVSAAVGAIGYQVGVEGNEGELSLGGLLGGLVALFLAYLLGGWTAGRIARYDGPRNGLMTGVWTLLLAAILAALGALLGDEYNVLAEVDLPNWFSRDALATGAIISGLIAIATMLLAGLLGGAWGERYHRRADEAIAATNEGAVLHEERRVREG